MKAILRNQALGIRISHIKSVNPMWNEDLIFVALEPFEEPLILSVENRVGDNTDEDFPEIVPLRKGVNRFVVNTRKTPLKWRF